MANGQGLTLEDLYLIQLELAGATPEEAERILDRLIGEGRITQEQLNELVNWYGENVGADKEEISPLVKRERQIALDEAKLRVSRDPLISWDEKALIWGAEGKKLEKAYLEEGDKTILDILGRVAKRGELKGQEFRKERELKLTQAEWGLKRYPETKKLLETITPDEERAYLSGESDELLDKLSGFYEEANIARRAEWEEGVEAQKAQTKEAQEAQRAKAALGGIAELGKAAPKEEFVRPTMPGTEKVTKSFLEETGLAKGTKLRSFLAGEFIPDVLKETRGAREAWWRRMHPEPVEEEDIAGEISQLQEEARRWAGLAWGPRAASEADVYGGVFYGPGGLRSVAERAYRGALRQLGERQAEQERGGEGDGRGEHPLAPRPGSDPLIAALRKRKWKPEYFRKPGAGLVRALTPAIRY